MARTTRFKFYLSPDTAWEGMYHACSQARFSIDCEQYIFEDDFLGRRFCELFIQKALAGVRVHLLLDAVGSRSLAKSKVLTDLRNAGVHVQFFNTIELWWIHKLISWFLRNHRKLLIVDGDTAFIGGVGMRADTSGQRDTHLRIMGPVVDECISAFERMWEKTMSGGYFFGFKKPIVPDSDFTLLTNSPYYRQRFTYQTLVRKIRESQKYIYLTTPYFIPDRRLSRALRGAARRGVEVRLLVSKKSDHVITDLAGQSYFWLALRSGIRIFEYQPSFIHAKTFVIDDAWASVGSSNLDNLSLLFNYEADIASTHLTFIDEVKWQFIEDTKQSVEIIRGEWKRRPFLRKIGELATWPFHRFL